MSDRSHTTLIYNVRVVLPDSVLDQGAVLLRAGRIAAVLPALSDMVEPVERAIDGRGALLLPGIIDLHNDSLETEINPRPDTNLPLDFALANLERRLLASGVTTEFHAIAFMDLPRSRRTVAQADERADFLAEYRASGRALLDHQVLHRLDVWSPESLDAIIASLRRFPVPYLSLNDHTPGQGQYRDLSSYVERMTAWAAARGGPAPDAAELQRRIARHTSDNQTLPFVYGRIRDAAAAAPIVVASHDDDSAAKVDTLWETGARVAEFPVTIDAAQRARDRGMTIVVGAPNIVRGGSSSGNLDARELFELGLADAICADYHAPSLLPAAGKLVADGLLDLPAAVRALTLNPARAVGLADVGAIRPGWRADLALARLDGATLHIETVIRDGQVAYNLRMPEPALVA